MLGHSSLRLGAAALSAVVLTTSLSAARVDDVVDAVQARLDQMNDFTAAVEQEVVLASAGRTVEAEGTVAFKRPGRMRWELRSDETQVIVADGTTLWFYQPEEQQVIKSPFEVAFRSSTPVSFLTGVGRIRDDFEVSLAESSEGRVALNLVPRSDTGEVGRLRLTVDGTSYDIVEAEVRDPLGNLTRLKFSDVKRNQGLGEDLFQFEVPPGVDVVEAPIGR